MQSRRRPASGQVVTSVIGPTPTYPNIAANVCSQGQSGRGRSRLLKTESDPEQRYQQIAPGTLNEVIVVIASSFSDEWTASFSTIRENTMPRRLKLSQLQRDIMWTPQEAGGETVGTVTATVKPLVQIEFDRAVVELIKLGLVRMESSTMHHDKAELVLTETGIEALRK